MPTLALSLVDSVWSTLWMSLWPILWPDSGLVGIVNEVGIIAKSRQRVSIVIASFVRFWIISIVVEPLPEVSSRARFCIHQQRSLDSESVPQVALKPCRRPQPHPE